MTDRSQGLLSSCRRTSSSISHVSFQGDLSPSEHEPRPVFHQQQRAHHHHRVCKWQLHCFFLFCFSVLFNSSIFFFLGGGGKKVGLCSIKRDPLSPEKQLPFRVKSNAGWKPVVNSRTTIKKIQISTLQQLASSFCHQASCYCFPNHIFACQLVDEKISEKQTFVSGDCWVWWSPLLSLDKSQSLVSTTRWREETCDLQRPVMETMFGGL